MTRFEHTRQPDWDWWGRLWPAPGETLRRLSVSSGDRVAEIGSGDGYFALPAARIAEPAPVYALDIDGSLLADLARLADRNGIGNVTTIEGDARALSHHLPEPVDVLLLANTFHGVDAPAEFVEEAFASVRPEGRFVVVNWRNVPRERTTVAGEPRGPPTERRQAPEETERLVTDAAEFTLAETVDLPPYHYALMFER